MNLNKFFNLKHGGEFLARMDERNMKMKSVLVIGMGRFGRHLSMRMAQLGNEVMIVDTNEERVQDVLPFVTNGQIGDCKKEETLRSLGVSDFDLCFVCIGSNFQSSLEVTSLLKELGAKFVISKASRDIHEKFLLRNGADSVVYPEKNIADKLAAQYSAKNVFDYISLTDDVSIYEVPIHPSWINKSLSDLEIRSKYKVNVLAIKNSGVVNPLPEPDYVFNSGDHIMIVGRKYDVEKLLKYI